MVKLVVIYQCGMGGMWVQGGGYAHLDATNETKICEVNVREWPRKRQVDSLFIYAHFAMDIINFFIFNAKMKTHFLVIRYRCASGSHQRAKTYVTDLIYVTTNFSYSRVLIRYYCHIYYQYLCKCLEIKSYDNEEILGETIMT